MIGSVAEFARYWDGVRRRTGVAVDRVGPELLGWATRPGELTCGEIGRHLAGAERFFVAKVVEDRFTEDDRALASPRRDLDGAAVKAWRFLMALVEHEVHHRRRMEDVLAQVAGRSAGPVGGPR